MATDDHHHVDLIPGTEVMGEVDDLDNGIFMYGINQSSVDALLTN